ncbi:uncharacterized protein FPRN_11116 [Fusarium proliferatum]|nr:uncharacterized protein FPRN_11116 [Fusarium proliferatum]
MSFANAGEIFELSTSEPMALPAKSYEPAMGMPRFVSELQPWGVVDLDGALIGFRFMNPSGDDTNVMAASDISPNALVFHAPPPRRVIGKLECDGSRYTPTNLDDARSQLSQYERAIILVSDDTQRFSAGDPQWDSDKVQGATAKVILEEVPLNGPSAEPSELVRMKLD